MTAPPNEGLWDFAVRAYAGEGVADLCLRLQDEHDLDVDIVLASLWLAARGVATDEPGLDAMLRASASARARVVEIRRLRRAVGDDRREDPAWQSTYEHLKATELAAERVELQRIEAATNSLGPRAEAEPVPLALDGLRRYAHRSGARSCDALLARLADLVLGSAPGRS